MKYPAFICALLFALVVPVMQAVAQGTNDDLARRIYNFEHRLMPRFVHSAEGKVFADLINDQGRGVRSIAAEVVSPEFAEGMQIKTIVPGKAVLISFPEPNTPLLCYHAIVAKTDTGYSYYTLEKAADIAGDGSVKAMYCNWLSQTRRSNFGPRGYTDADSFEKEYLANPDPREPEMVMDLPDRAAN